MTTRAGQPWTRDELILVLDLYFDPTVQRDDPDPDVQRLAKLIGRTPSAVAYKMHNVEAKDPSVRARKKGLTHGGRLDEQVFLEFVNKEKELRVVAKDLWERRGWGGPTTEGDVADETANILKGSFRVDDHVSQAKVRRKQDAFRTVVLGNYGGQCCMCDVDVSALLIASHIKPWTKDIDNRLNPQNGLCLCSLHDKAFDRGLISIDDQVMVMVWRGIASSVSRVVTEQLRNLEGVTVRPPLRDSPAEKFLKYHRNWIFGRTRRIIV